MARRILSGLFGLLKKETTQAGRPDMTRLPRHIAIILDGNGRWAKKRGLPRRSGHAVGADTFRTIATYCRDLGVDRELETACAGSGSHHETAWRLSGRGCP